MNKVFKIICHEKKTHFRVPFGSSNRKAPDFYFSQLCQGEEGEEQRGPEGEGGEVGEDEQADHPGKAETADARLGCQYLQTFHVVPGPDLLAHLLLRQEQDRVKSSPLLFMEFKFL